MSFTSIHVGTLIREDLNIIVEKSIDDSRHYVLKLRARDMTIGIELTPSQLAEIDETVHDFIAKETASADLMLPLKKEIAE